MEAFEKHLERILSGTGYQTNWIQKRKLLETKDPVVIFGAGAVGASCFDMLTDWGCHGEIFFCDNFKTGTKKGKTIISFGRLLADSRFSSSLIVVAIGRKHFPEVCRQLQENGIPEGRMIPRDSICEKADAAYMESNRANLKTIYGRLKDTLSRDVFWKKIEQAMYCEINVDPVYREGAAQYFDPCLPLNDKEVFVDGGAFTGDTAAEFIRRTGGRYRHIFEFEPEEANVKAIGENLRPYQNITVINKGLWDRETTLRFNAGGGAASCVSRSGETSIPVTRVDALLPTGYIPTFIKMDIEGSELMALRGAAQTIRAYKPKLAVCIYHRPMDIVEIPTLVCRLNPDYIFCLRQYAPGFSWAETVLYAV